MLNLNSYKNIVLFYIVVNYYCNIEEKLYTSHCNLSLYYSYSLMAQVKITTTIKENFRKNHHLFVTLNLARVKFDSEKNDFVILLLIFTTFTFLNTDRMRLIFDH